MYNELVSGFPQFDPTAFVGNHEKEEYTDLDLLFNNQRTLMDACGITQMSPDVAFWVTNFALVGEVTETCHNFMDLTKPWKVNPSIDLAEVKEEVIDQLFFVLQNMILLGMTPDEVVASYLEKSKKNFQRIIEKMRGELS